ncbi:MAG: hypothetical protein QNJ00_17425 [Woeseiaceae bacterium]|nr:hypothetical protein [Woeseiaceae bacterium]
MAELSYATIVVSGDDAREFLQGQLTQDVARLDENATNPPLLSAWCNPKGRVIALLRLSKTGSGYALALPAELADAVVKRLTMFRFRSKVDFETRLATPAELGFDGASEDFLLTSLRDGIADIRGPQSEEFTPHMLNLDLLDAVSLDKGCYTGQEIVARTHYRGATKRRMLRFTSSAPVSAGDKVEDGDRSVGEVVNAIGNELLAVVPVDSTDGLKVGDAALEASSLPYL